MREESCVLGNRILRKEVERVQLMFVPELAVGILGSVIATILFELSRLGYTRLEIARKKKSA